MGFLIYKADSSSLHTIWRRFEFSIRDKLPLLFQVKFFFFIVEPPVGSEPKTLALRTPYSPNWSMVPYFIYIKLLSTTQIKKYYYLQNQHNESNKDSEKLHCMIVVVQPSLNFILIKYLSNVWW